MTGQSCWVTAHRGRDAPNEAKRGSCRSRIGSERVTWRAIDAMAYIVTATNASTSSPTTASTPHRPRTPPLAPRRRCRGDAEAIAAADIDTGASPGDPLDSACDRRIVPHRASGCHAAGRSSRRRAAHRYAWIIEQLHQPAHRRHPAALSARRTHRPPLPRPPHRRQPHRRGRVQDRLRRPRHHALITRRRHTAQPRCRQRRPARPRATPPTTGTMRTQKRGPPASSATTSTSARPLAALPGIASRRHHRHATWRTRRPPLGRLATHTDIGSRSPAADKSSADNRSKSPSRPAPAAAASIWTRPPKRTSTLARQPTTDGHPVGLADPIFTNASGWPVHAESISQLFDRHLARTGLPRIRFHDLRHTHASLLVAAGTPIKVVSERLGHAHPGFTMATYQHLVPGMSATPPPCFANLIASRVTPPLEMPESR